MGPEELRRKPVYNQPRRVNAHRLDVVLAEAYERARSPICRKRNDPILLRAHDPEDVVQIHTTSPALAPALRPGKAPPLH